MEEELKKYGLKIRWSDNPDASPIDFSIEDDQDNVCWVWGNSIDDIEVECDHPVVEYDDDETVGECPVCGATCSAHYETDAGNVEDYYWSGRVLTPHEWFPRKTPGGIIGDILKEISDGKRRNVQFKKMVLEAS